jgi:DNA-directed RNA polymerase specialized sigma24 family protein
MLRYLGGADYESIARQLALSNGSLRGLLHRGMAMLREQMKGGD